MGCDCLNSGCFLRIISNNDLAAISSSVVFFFLDGGDTVLMGTLIGLFGTYILNSIFSAFALLLLACRFSFIN
jgi:hypothetical protein